MHKPHGKNHHKLAAPKLKSGETLMLVCQGAVLRVQDPNNSHGYFDIDTPEHAEKMDLRRGGHIEIHFAEGDERLGCARWIYAVNIDSRALEPVVSASSMAVPCAAAR